MAFVIADNAKETTTTSGTGNYTSSGTAAAGYLTIAAAIGESNQSCFCVRSGSDAEIFLGTVGAGNAITRDLILSSTNGGDPVNWPDSEAKDIFCTMSATLMVFLAAALQGGDAGKGVVVNAGGNGFELGGPFLPKAGGEATGAIVVAPAAVEAQFNANAPSGKNASFSAMLEGNLRWKWGGIAPTHDFGILRYDVSGDFVDMPFSIETDTGLAKVKDDPTEALGIATKQFVEALAVTPFASNADATAKEAGDKALVPSNIPHFGYMSDPGTTYSSISGYVSEPHGLGAQPLRRGGEMVCLSDDAGYTAGERVNASDFSASPSGVNGIAIRSNATNVAAACAGSLTVRHATTGADVGIDETKWLLVLTASLLP